MKVYKRILKPFGLDLYHPETRAGHGHRISLWHVGISQHGVNWNLGGIARREHST